MLDLKPMLGTKPTTNVISLILYTQLEVLRSWSQVARTSNLHLLVVLEHINLILLGSARAYQPRTTNESHKTGGNNARAWITLYRLATWSHLKTW